MSNYAERLEVLLAHREGLLYQLNRARVTFQDEKNYPEVTKKIDGIKTVTKLAKGFPRPAPIDRIQGNYSLLEIRNNSEVILEETSWVYWAFHNAFEFRDEALRLLNEISGTCTLALDSNPLLSHRFMQLLISLIEIGFLIGEFKDRALVLTLHDIAHYFFAKKRDEHYKKLAAFVYKYKDPLSVLHGDLNHLDQSISGILSSLIMNMSIASDSVALRSQGKLSLVRHPETLRVVDIDDEFLEVTTNFSEYTRWIIFGAMVCPQIFETPGIPELVKTILSNNYIAHIYGDIYIPPHSYISKTLKHSQYKSLKLSKHVKSVVSPALTKAASTGPSLHKDFRLYLEYEIKQAMNLLKSSVGLIPIKLSTCFSLLGLAKHEINWFFIHKAGGIPKNAKVKSVQTNDEGDMAKVLEKYMPQKEEEPANFEYASVAALIDASREMVNLLRDNKTRIRKYYVTFVSTLDSALVREMFESRLGALEELDGSVKELYLSLARDLGNLDPSVIESGKFYDLSALKMNWLRIESTMSSRKHVKLSCLISKQKPLGVDMKRLYRRLEIIDILDVLIDRHSGLVDLYPFVGELYEIFKKCVKSYEGGQLHVQTYIDLLKEFHKYIHPLNYDDSKRLGETVSGYMMDFVKFIVSEITKHVMHIMGHSGLLAFDKQMSPSKAADIIKLRRMSRQNRRRMKGRRGHEQEMTPAQKKLSEKIVLPGTESTEKSMDTEAIWKLRKWRHIVQSLSAVVHRNPIIYIYDKAIIPSDMLKKSLKSRILKYLKQNVVVIEKYKKEQYRRVQKPSDYKSVIKNLITVLKDVEQSVKISAEELMKEIVHEGIIVGTEGPSGQLVDYLSNNKIPQKSLVYDYVELFSKFIDVYALENTIYSPKYQSFIDKAKKKRVPKRGEKIVKGEKVAAKAGAKHAGMPYYSDSYFSHDEFVAFAEIFGPYGVRAIDNMIVSKLMKKLTKINSLLERNSEALDAFSKAYWKKDEASKVLKKFTGFDTLFRVSTQIGLMFQLRESLYGALRLSLKSDFSMLYSLVEFGFSQYPNNTFGVPGFINMDMLAQSAAVTLGTTVDHPFRVGLIKFLSGNVSKSWSNLLYLYAAMFSSDAWDKTRYIPDLDACSNNSHLIVKAIDKLLIIPMLLAQIHDDKEGQDDNDEEAKEMWDILNEQYETFVKVSSFTILQMLGGKDGEKKKVSISSMLTLLNHLVSESSFLTLDYLDTLVPYTLIRTTYAYLSNTEDKTKGKLDPSEIGDDKQKADEKIEV